MRDDLELYDELESKGFKPSVLKSVAQSGKDVSFTLGSNDSFAVVIWYANGGGDQYTFKWRVAKRTPEKFYDHEWETELTRAAERAWELFKADLFTGENEWVEHLIGNYSLDTPYGQYWIYNESDVGVQWQLTFEGQETEAETISQAMADVGVDLKKRTENDK